MTDEAKAVTEPESINSITTNHHQGEPKMNRSLRTAPLKRNESALIKTKDGKVIERRAKKPREWQAMLGQKTTRPVPGNVGGLKPRKSYPAPTQTGPILNPYKGPSAYRDKGCLTPEEFKNRKKKKRQKPRQQIVGILR